MLTDRHKIGYKLPRLSCQAALMVGSSYREAKTPDFTGGFLFTLPLFI